MSPQKKVCEVVDLKLINQLGGFVQNIELTVALGVAVRVFIMSSGEAD